jgi:hypothetical protein
VALNGDQLVRVLGPGRQQMTCGQLFDRAHGLERSATFALRFARVACEAKLSDFWRRSKAGHDTHVPKTERPGRGVRA